MSNSRIVTSYKESLGLNLRSTGGATSIFGSIAGGTIPSRTTMGFIPLDNKGKTLDLTGLGGDHPAKWLGLATKEMQYWAYNFCSPLAAVIDRLAEADTNGKIELVNEDGTTNKNYTKNPSLYRVMKLLKKPNPLQTWEEFNSQQVVLCKIFGYCPVFAIGGTLDKTYTKSLWNLNPFFVTPIKSENFSFFDNEGSPIKEWRGSFFGKEYAIPDSDILLIKDGTIDSVVPDMGLPISKVAGLDYFVSNICAAMEADNVLLKKKGPLGIFSHDPKPDMAGWVPLTPDQKDEIQNDLKQYGLTLGQLQYIVSKTPIKWNAMSFNLRDLMTKETVRQGIDGICDRYGYPAELMSGKNATYENRNSAEKFLYQNNVIPFSLRRMRRYDQFFGIEGLSLDYDHLPVLQEDIMHAGQAAKALSESLVLDWTNGIITYNEYRTAKQLDTVAGMDIYYNEYIKQFPPPEQKVKTNGAA